jgi:glutamate synthase domain-containing protein 3
MTGGTVVVLGKTGRNFAAGMSGGIAYVYDEDGQFASRCNTAMVSLAPVATTAEQEKSVDRAIWHREQTDEALLKSLVADHHKWTGSLRAREILDHWTEARGRFVKVFPNEYKRALAEISLKAMTALGEIRAGSVADDAIAKAKGGAVKTIKVSAPK